MTKLEDTPTPKLYELLSMIENEKITEGDLDIDSKDELIDIIAFDILQLGYNGDNNYEAMFWFMKGREQTKNTNEVPPSPSANVPPPREIPRYIDNNDYYFLKNIKNNIWRKVTKDDSFVKITYNDFIKLKDEQEKIVDAIMKKLYDSPEYWHINFEQLTNRGRELIFPALHNFFNTIVKNFSVTNQYKLRFKVNNEWRTLPLTSENFNKLMENFTKKHFIFDMDDVKPEYFYEKGSMELPEWSLFSQLIFSKTKNVRSNADRGGSFFQFLVKESCPKEIVKYLTRLQIFDNLANNKGTQRKELDDCCFIYALQQTGSYDEETLNQMRLRINNRYLSNSAINNLCQEFKIHISVSYINEDANSKNKKKSLGKNSYIGVEKAEPNRTHKFNIYEKHYFIEEKTPFSTYYINNLTSLTPDKASMEYKQGHWIKARYFISSSNLVRTLMKENYFRPLNFGDGCILKTVFNDDIKKDVSRINLEYDEKSCTQLIKPRTFKKKGGDEKQGQKSYWYCDSEADTSGDIHRPYMFVLQSQDGTITKTFKGEDCSVSFLDFLPDFSVVYFHNLAYDIRFLCSYGIRKSVIKGNKFMKGTIIYKSKTLYFRDTLPILSCKLSQLPSMFNLDSGQKEVFPYKYYTMERLSKNIGVIEEAGENEDKRWTEETKQQFRHNIDIIGCRLSDTTFDMYKYAEFYCAQDVNILRQGFNKFRDGFIEDFNIDPFNFVSISSLANEVFNNKVYYGHDLYKIGGVPRYFCAHAIYGGRCMTAYNKKWHTQKKVCDFDAVSLYPSAMARLWTVSGTPKVIEKENLNMEFLSKQSAYVVEIEVTKVNKHYPFPLLVRKVNNLNLNDDNIDEPVTMIVDNIYLTDLIRFQKIEFTLLRGYYWDGKKDYTIRKVIREIFNKRLEYKKQKNPLQNLYKLIMNSCYGKTIERPTDKEFKYMYEGEELDKYWKKNYMKIKEDVQLHNSKLHSLKVLKPIDDHFNFSLLGIQVLSMSKRIMNEVMCLAYDIGCHIYYQDTDSMHIELADLPKLEKAYKEMYGRELIGSNLGQFHSDFPTINKHDEIPVAIESYFLMKKMYIDKLTDSTGDMDFMIRGKGLTLNSIKHAAKQFGGDYMKLYEHLYNGNSVMFDLTQGQPCFKFNSNMTISTLTKFQRKIKTNYEEGYE